MAFLWIYPIVRKSPLINKACIICNHLLFYILGHQTKSSGLSTTGDNTNDIIFTCVQAIFATPPELTSLRNKIGRKLKLVYKLICLNNIVVICYYIVSW